jgi:hypothetical protein
VEDANGRVSLTWLESAALEYSGASWRVLFLHSTRALPTTTGHAERDGLNSLPQTLQSAGAPSVE